MIRFNPMQTFSPNNADAVTNQEMACPNTRHQSPGTRSVKHPPPGDMVLGFVLLLPVWWTSDLLYPGSLYGWWVLDRILVTAEIRTLSRDLDMFL